MPNQNQIKYVPAGTGPMYFGPGDRVSFLVTGTESHGGCFIFEGMAAPGGGPPPHVHHRGRVLLHPGGHCHGRSGRADDPRQARGFHTHPARHGAHAEERRRCACQGAHHRFAGGPDGHAAVLRGIVLSHDGPLGFPTGDHRGAGEADDGCCREKRNGVGQTGMTMPMVSSPPSKTLIPKQPPRL